MDVKECISSCVKAESGTSSVTTKTATYGSQQLDFFIHFNCFNFNKKSFIKKNVRTVLKFTCDGFDSYFVDVGTLDRPMGCCQEPTFIIKTILINHSLFKLYINTELSSLLIYLKYDFPTIV
jgi:hypothetical protein